MHGAHCALGVLCCASSTRQSCSKWSKMLLLFFQRPRRSLLLLFFCFLFFFFFEGAFFFFLLANTWLTLFFNRWNFYIFSTGGIRSPFFYSAGPVSESGVTSSQQRSHQPAVSVCHQPKAVKLRDSTPPCLILTTGARSVTCVLTKRPPAARSRSIAHAELG